MLDCNYLNQYSIQTILIGKQSCGKTTLIETLSGHLNKGLSQYWSSKEFGVSNIDLQFQEFVTEEIDERFILEISQSDYPIIVILTFDINDPSSFDEIVNNYCIMQMLKTIGVSQGRFILLGAKHDLKNEVQDQEISHFLSSQQYNLSYQCVSAKNNKGIKELKQSLFNLAKQQIAQIIPNTSTGSKWQSMDEKLDESYWTSNQSYNSQNRHVKIADRRSKEIPQIEEVMNILNSYKNNYFDNQLDSSYQHEEQSLSSQYEEYTETQSSQSEKLHNEHINSKVSQYGIECKQELEEQQENFYDLMNKKEEYQQVNDLEQEEIQDNTIKQICQNPLEKQQMINVSKQIYEDVDSQHQNCSPRTVNQSKQQIVCELKHELIQKQQTDLDRYFEQIGRKAQSVNKFNTINSNSSISSSYSRIYDNNKKNNIQNSHRSQQTQLVDNHDSSCNSEKWEIGVLEQIDESCQNKSQQNNQILEDKIKQQNHLYPKKVQQSSVMSETGRNLQQTSYDKKNEKIYANPLNNLTNRERSNFYQINQSEIEKDSQDESLQIDDQKNNLFSEMSSCQINQIHFHQIHSHKQHKVTQSLYSEKENSFENIFQKQRNQTELNKSQIYQVKINLEKSSKNDKIVFQEIQNYNNKSIKSVKKSITKKDQESSSNKSEKENFSKKQDKKNEPNSFQKKKNTKYLMSLCLQFQDQQIYIDVLENESSFDIAHQFCKKANILPTINQIKKCQKIIQQQIEEYTQNLDRKLESIERKVLEQKEEKFESLMNQFLKENKNFLMDVNNPDVYDSNFKLISKLNQNLLQNNLTKTTNLFNQQNKTKTPTKTPTKSPSRTPKITPTKVPKTNLYVRSKSPTPLFKSTCKI